MSIFKCHDCGKEISILAGACPGCGSLVTMNPVDIPKDRQEIGEEIQIQQVFAVMLFCVGVLCHFGANGNDIVGKIAVLCLIVSVVWMIWLWFLAWWKFA